jgi:hypothetical protein
MSRFDKIISKLATDKASQEKEALEEQGIADKLLDLLDRPGRATRAGISALQNDRDAIEAVRAQFGKNAPEAPTGADIAQKFSDDTGVENPIALGALATLADVVDPSMIVPGGQVTKLGKGMRMLGKGAKAKKADSVLTNIGKARVETRNPAEAIKVREILSDPKYADLDIVKKAKMKTGDIKPRDTVAMGEAKDLRYTPPVEKADNVIPMKPQKEMSDFEKRLAEFNRRKAARLAKESKD